GGPRDGGRTQGLLLVWSPLGGSQGLWAVRCPPLLCRGEVISSLQFLFRERLRSGAPPHLSVGLLMASTPLFFLFSFRHRTDAQSPPSQRCCSCCCPCCGLVSGARREGGGGVGLQLTLISPQGPWLRMGDSGLQDGLCIHVPCIFPYIQNGWTESTPAHGYWFWEGANPYQDVCVATNNLDCKVQEETQGRIHLLGDPRTYNCSLDIRDARKRDNRRYFSQVEKRNIARYSYTQNQLSMCVLTSSSQRPWSPATQLPQEPDLFFALGGIPPIFFWTSDALISLGPRAHLSSVLTLTPWPEDHGTNLPCQVKFPAASVIVERTIQLNNTCECWARTPGTMRKIPSMFPGHRANSPVTAALEPDTSRGSPPASLPLCLSIISSETGETSRILCLRDAVPAAAPAMSRDPGSGWGTLAASSGVCDSAKRPWVSVTCTFSYRRDYWSDSTPEHGYWF
ncbi:hypothetical protein HPG69_014027, partial [Diceros bicornis minor]